jgi:hypothetical protein
MSEYEDFPPYEYFLMVLKSSPKSALLYIDLWNFKDEEFSFFVKKEDILNKFLVTPTLFRNFLIPLVGMKLLSIKETQTTYTIELVSYDCDFYENNESS